MSTSDFPKRFSVGVSEKAHANLRAAAKALKVEQNMVLTMLLEDLKDLKDVEHYRERAAAHKKAKASTSVRSLMSAMKGLTLEERERIMQEVRGGKK